MILLTLTICTLASFALGYVRGRTVGLECASDIAASVARTARQGDGEDAYEIGTYEAAQYIAYRLLLQRDQWL